MFLSGGPESGSSRTNRQCASKQYMSVQLQMTQVFEKIYISRETVAQFKQQNLVLVQPTES